MLFVTPEVARDIAEIIRQYHVGVAAVFAGRAGMSEDDWKLAVALGVVDPNAGEDSIIRDLHVYGALMAHMAQSKAQPRYGTTLDEMRAEIAKNPIPMTTSEHKAAEWSAQKAASLIVGLGNKQGATIGSKLIEADRELDKRLRGVIRDVVSAKFGDADAAARMKELGQAEGLGSEFFDDQFRSTIGRMKSDIGHATKDWARDNQRIAQTESHTALSEGMAERFKAEEDEAAEEAARAPRRLLAYKLPRPDACKHCLRLHLDGGVPRIYYLDEIEGNGTNHGRRAADWLIVIGSTHPWCSCSLLQVPALLEMPKSWRSGEAAPSVIGPGGRLA